MLLQILKQASATGITASSVATVKIPTTGSIYGIFLMPLSSAGAAVSVANMKTAIGNMVLYYDGVQIMEMTATFALDLQKYYGDCYVGGNVAGVIPIPIAPNHFNNFTERQVFAAGTIGINTISMNLNILSTTNMATIDVLAEISNELRPLGTHIRIKKNVQNFATTGDQEISTLPLEGETVAYKALHIEAGSGPGVFDKVTVKVGNFALYDQVKVALAQVLLNYGRRTPQSGYYHVDFGRSNDIISFLAMKGVKDFRQTISWLTTAPGNFNIYAEEIFGLDPTKIA